MGEVEERFFTSFSELRQKDDQQSMFLLLKNFQSTFDFKYSKTINESTLQIFTKCLLRYLQKFLLENDGRTSSENFSAKKINLEFILECSKILRNLCFDCNHNQNLIVNFIEGEAKLIDACGNFLTFFTINNLSDEDCVNTAKFMLQFLHNLCVNNSEAKLGIWRALNLATVSKLLESCHEKVAVSSTALLYQLLLNENIAKDICANYCFIVHKVIFVLIKHETEWGVFIMELCLQFYDLDLINFFNNQPYTARLFLLDLIISAYERSQSYSIKISNVNALSQIFKSTSKKLLDLHKQMDSFNEQEALVVCRILSLLCVISSKQTSDLQTDTELLKCSLELLYGINLIGNKDSNKFSPAGKITDVADQDSPSFGLRRDLVCIIGNMSYKNKSNQDMVRSLNGLQLILNHTGIDKKNPYITQWSILAIRNLCEDNEDNKKIISNMKLTGIDEQSKKLLNELNIQAAVEKEKIMISKQE